MEQLGYHHHDVLVPSRHPVEKTGFLSPHTHTHTHTHTSLSHHRVKHDTAATHHTMLPPPFSMINTDLF